MKIVWSSRAIGHLVQIREYIEYDDTAAARRVADRILQSVERLTEQPHMGRPGRITGTRELIVPGTPYVVPYRVRREILEIMAIFHGWQKWPVR